MFKFQGQLPPPVLHIPKLSKLVSRLRHSHATATSSGIRQPSLVPVKTIHWTFAQVEYQVRMISDMPSGVAANVKLLSATSDNIQASNKHSSKLDSMP